jgi:hypothetical protein
MNPRRPYSNRPGGRSFSSGGGGGNRGSGRGGFGGGRPRGRGGRKPDLPMLLGEPSPSLAKINTMNMAKLEEKIASLQDERQRMLAKIERLEKMNPPPEDKIKAGRDTVVRLEALEKAASERLAGKAERKAQREQRRG